ncbi:uncharacterized protein BDV14DRAFT_191480 [Aspergillus stella-maris]|uniref:uncharacterized protein n=1 Tax=Aspergillus stella-maris TaxID=1810926 RepID=UPI003CCD8C7A
MAFTSPPPARPQWPLAIRPETVATVEPETIITVRNRPEPWHPLDYTIAHENGTTLFTVHGHPWSLAQRRVFRDASGFALFELRNRWYDSSTVELKRLGARTDNEPLLSAKCRVAVQAPRAVLQFPNACVPMTARPSVEKGHKHKMSLPHSRPRSYSLEADTVMEIYAMDVDNLVQVAVVGDQRVAFIERVTDPGVLAQGQKPPYKFRPMWKVRVARGVDLALVAVAVVIISQQVTAIGLAGR